MEFFVFFFYVVINGFGWFYVCSKLVYYWILNIFEMFIEICLVFWYFGCIFYEKSCLMFIRSYRNKFDVEENIELKKGIIVFYLCVIKR